MKAFITAFLTLTLILSMAACTSRKDETPSSSVAPSSSMESSLYESSSIPESSMIEDLESGASTAMSKIESAVAPTMSTDFDKIGALGAAPIQYGPGVNVDTANRSTEADRFQGMYGDYSAYFIGPRDCGKFYLTFDEGYENGHTPAILDVLKEKQASAVFFVTMPFVKAEPALVQRMIDEGHIVGNHTNHHWNPTQKSLDDAYRDIKELHDYVAENFNYQMTLYRPPEGVFSEQVLAMAQKAGYTTVIWSFAYADWDPKKQVGYDAALARTEKYIHEGAIYLLHAVGKDNSEILPQLIDDVRAKGLEIAPFDLPYVAGAMDAREAG